MTEMTFEIEDELFAQAVAVADARGTTVAEMVRIFFCDLGRSDQVPD